MPPYPPKRLVLCTAQGVLCTHQDNTPVLWPCNFRNGQPKLAILSKQEFFLILYTESGINISVCCIFSGMHGHFFSSTNITFNNFLIDYLIGHITIFILHQYSLRYTIYCCIMVCLECFDIWEKMKSLKSTKNLPAGS